MYLKIHLFFIFVINLLCFYKFLDNSYVMGNGFLSILTYGSFIPVLLLPSKFFTEQKIITKISKIILVIIIIESLIGIIQSIYGFLVLVFTILATVILLKGLFIQILNQRNQCQIQFLLLYYHHY